MTEPRSDLHPIYGTPPTGTPLYAATISVDSLHRSIRFYEQHLGLDVVERVTLGADQVARHWQVPRVVSAEMAVLADRGCAVGRLALIEFRASGRERMRTAEGQRFFGLVNLNFYTDGIYAHTARLEAAGCRAWSEPVVHPMGAVGEPIEVMLEAPDGVILNLIELQGRDPTARVLRTRKYIDDTGGFNRCGSTALATSQHCVRDHARALAFGTEVLGMSIRNDVTLAGADMEIFMRYPPGARTRDTYLQGNHVYGKIAVNHPLNFECEDLIPRAAAPNIGLLAHTFVVTDLADAMSRVAEQQATVYSEPMEMRVAGLGHVLGAVVRNPGSGALHELMQPL